MGWTHERIDEIVDALDAHDFVSAAWVQGLQDDYRKLDAGVTALLAEVERLTVERNEARSEVFALEDSEDAMRVIAEDERDAALGEVKRLTAELAEAHPHYTGTGCIHGLHEQCKRRCKTCDAPCRCRAPGCPCVTQANDPRPASMLRRVDFAIDEPWRDYTIEGDLDRVAFVLCRSDDACEAATSSKLGRYLTLGEAVDWATAHAAEHEEITLSLEPVSQADLVSIAAIGAMRSVPNLHVELDDEGLDMDLESIVLPDLAKVIRTGRVVWDDNDCVWHASSEDDSYPEVNQLYAHLETAKARSVELYLDEELLGPDAEEDPELAEEAKLDREHHAASLSWQQLGTSWDLMRTKSDNKSWTGVFIAKRSIDRTRLSQRCSAVDNLNQCTLTTGHTGSHDLPEIF